MRSPFLSSADNSCEDDNEIEEICDEGIVVGASGAGPAKSWLRILYGWPPSDCGNASHGPRFW